MVKEEAHEPEPVQQPLIEQEQHQEQEQEQEQEHFIGTETD